MSTEREHTHAQHDAATTPTQDDLAPGLMSRSAKLDAPEKPIASGLIARKAARDDNGVADGADAAIAKAGSSSGSSLPEPIMRKFESSLGADLSSVRVHTGADSASAASAVGAKAYTMGQDIHFGAGQYDPSSSGGQHLLAHEVAHTVQQNGGSPRRQNKLEVSSPHDAAEHEADHAADAMISGRTASVSLGSGVVRKVMRDKAEDQARIAAAKEDFDTAVQAASLLFGNIAQQQGFIVQQTKEAAGAVEAPALGLQIIAGIVGGAIGAVAGPLGAAIAAKAASVVVQKLAQDLAQKAIESAIEKGGEAAKETASKKITELKNAETAEMYFNCTQLTFGALAGRQSTEFLHRMRAVWGSAKGDPTSA
ncbi:MAG TPA: DUF4157 domain-containing protein, partial [Kofleriaceae bacterium]|nr:DUF4157 domain-containing protein [Kofleriaceae bacterium]